MGLLKWVAVIRAFVSSEGLTIIEEIGDISYGIFEMFIVIGAVSGLAVSEVGQIFDKADGLARSASGS